MAYKAPILEEICLSINQLRHNYIKNKLYNHHVNNNVRLESILLIERLSKQILAMNDIKQSETLIGLILFVQLKLQNKYGSLSAWLPEDGGELNKLLKTVLALSKENSMSQQEQLIYLAQFYDFAQTALQDEWISDLHYQNKKQFIASFEVKLKQTIHAQRDYIDYVLKESPDFLALEKNIDKVLIDYETEYKSRMFTKFAYLKNHEREAALTFSKIIQSSCKQWMQDIAKNSLDEKFLMIQKSYLYDVRRGLIMFIVMPIYREHKRLSASGTLLNRGSALFKGMLGALNKSYDDFTQEERIQLLKALLNHLEKANIDFSMHKNINLSLITKTINHLIAEEEIDKNTPSSIELYTSIVINYASQYGLKMVVAKTATNVVMPNIGSMLIGASAGPLGIISYGIAGTIIESQLGKMVQEKIIDRATAIAYEYVLTAIGTYIGRFAAPNVMLAFELSATTLGKLLGFYQDLHQFNQGFAQKEVWIKTLHQLPNQLISPKEKNILQKTKSCCI